MTYLRNALAGLVVALLALPVEAKVWTPIDGDPSYRLTFDEEFNVMVGQPRWNVAGDAQDHTYSTYPNALFMPGNLTVHDGLADFTVTKVGANYHTSMITTENFAQSTGYWEARIKAPLNAKGIGDNFWLVCDNWACPQELDIYERSGTVPDKYRGMWNNGSGNWQGNTAIPGFTAGVWHVVGVLKTATTITWYLDGVQKLSLPTNGGTQPMQTMVGITVGPFGDLVDASTVFPSHLLVDYIHAYSKEAGAVAVTPQANYGGPGDTGGTAPPPSASLTVTSPVANATVSGSFAVSGAAWSPWVNVAVFNAAGAKVGADTAPVNGAYSTSVSTTGMPNGPNVLTIWAWNVPPGGSGGTSVSITVTVNVQQCACP